MTKLLALFIFASATGALAHQHIDPASARPNDNGTPGIKIDRPGTSGAPCGSTAAAVANIPAANKLQAGQNFTFKAYATIAHPGHEFVSIYSGSNPAQDEQFTPLELVSATYTTAANAVLPKVIENSNFKTAKMNRAQKGFKDLNQGCTTANRCFITLTVKIPTNMACNPTCTIQYVEQMEENVNQPTFYKSCMDVTIAGAQATGPTPTPDPSPTPTPTPNPNATPTPTPKPGHCD